jgi:hypothetical protein
LPLLRLLELISEHFILSAQAGDVRLDLLDIAKHVEHPRVLRFQPLEALRQLLLELLHANAQRVDALARLVVVEQRRARRGRRERDRKHDRRRDRRAFRSGASPRHAYSPT